MQSLINQKVHEYYWNDNLSCALTSLKILSEVFSVTIHPQVLEAAFGLNAGRCGLQCGLVQGPLLFIGLYGSQRGINRETLLVICRNYCREFQTRFGSLVCAELRPQGFCPNNPPHLCEEVTKQAIAFSVEFIKGFHDKKREFR